MGEQMSNPIDSLSRSVLKTALYRVLMFLVTFAVAFILTDNVTASVGISIGANFIKTITYFLYERVWSRIGWGRDLTSTGSEKE